MPALADGGPHVASLNSGISTLTTDSCAGCHRAHTAQGPYLLNAASEDALCLTCHGTTGSGATTDVMTGVQYAIGATHSVGSAQLGALRSGGFGQARIDSGNPARWLTLNNLSSSGSQWAKVRVGPAQNVTSAHLNLPENGLSAPQVAWGNGDIGLGDSGPGPVVDLACTSCHNPHGNGQYRILNPIPTPDSTSGTFAPVATGVTVTDSPLGTPDANLVYPTKNYTVLQVKGVYNLTTQKIGSAAANATFLLFASDVLDARGPRLKTWPAGDYSATSGDYWHVRVPWSSATRPPTPSSGIECAIAEDDEIELAEL
jgi:predicted CXXCH cytochrome family protein